MREVFVRIRYDGDIVELGKAEPILLKKSERHTIESVVDRLVIREGVRTRLADSVETALRWGGNRIVVLRQGGDGVMEKRSNDKSNTPSLQHSTTPPAEWETVRYTTDYGSAESDYSLGELTPKHFSFNSHLGACPACHGLGTQLVCDAELMSDPEKSLKEGAITPWRRGTKPMLAYYRNLQSALVKHFGVDEAMPFAELPDTFKQALY